MAASVDVAIIGAGPYGLSIAAHLGALDVDYRVFGEPMRLWRQHMPPGMFLKSDGKSSSLSDPGGTFTLEEFCRIQKLPYDHSLVPVKLETFAAYGQAFQQRFAARVEPRHLTRLERSGTRFNLGFADGELLSANRVVLAVGVLPFKNIPLPFTDLPPALVSHSSVFGSLEPLDGREVTIIGRGASALDLAALSHERGARVTLVTRAEKVMFHGPPPTRRSLLSQIRAPNSSMGFDWKLRICDDAPQFIHALPSSLRLKILYRLLPPAAGYVLRDNVVGKVEMKYRRSISSASVRGDRVVLRTQEPDGSEETIESDHLILATGYNYDVRRLSFLSPEIQESLEMIEKAPVLSANFESSVPGLFFTGFMSAPSFGPVMRFVSGAVHPARRLARHLARYRRPNAIQSPPRVAG